LFKIENLIACTGNSVPSAKAVFKDVVEIVFRCCGEEVAELEVVETTTMFQICIAKFIEIMDSGRIMRLKSITSRREDTGFIETGGGGGLTIKEP
jgi:hypothetical protein